jgi:uncharacterized protein
MMIAAGFAGHGCPWKCDKQSEVNGGETVFREIKRRNRSMPEQEARGILARAEHGVLATVGEDGWPYAVPLNHVLIDNAIYAHCARKGHKLDNIAHEARVSYCAVASARILPSEMTSLYESAIAFGRATVVTDEDERLRTLKLLTMRFLNCGEELYEEHMRLHGRGAAMIRIEIEHITGKAHRAEDVG